MIYVPPHDDDLAALVGAVLGSDLAPKVSYTIERVLGIGGMSVAFTALRVAADGQTRVVIKILRPSIARANTERAAMMVKKEAVSLGRLNERVPPTPFVVRFVDTGTLQVHDGQRTVDLPWLAVEHVHGGAEGTTLAERVLSSLRATNGAFDPERAENAVVCLSRGLAAIHEVGIIHRDFTPANVLCCGFGADEILKIADFGIARTGGAQGTFGGLAVGTPGYAAPEQLTNEESRLGPWSDVFALAAVVFYLLTGEDYFTADTPSAAVIQVHQPARRRLLDARFISRELRARPQSCAAIDNALARATAPNPDHRPQSADVLGAMLLPALRPEGARGRSYEARARSLAGRAGVVDGGYTWTNRSRPGGDRVIRSAAWESDGRCLAATSEGLAFFTGTDWLRPTLADLAAPDRFHFVRRVDAGVWLLGGAGATVYIYRDEGVAPLLNGKDSGERLTMVSGDIDDIAVFVGMREGEPPMLHAVAAGHWLKPAALTRASSITSLAQLDAERWLVTGRATTGDGFAVMYMPLEWEVKRVKTPPARAYLAVAARPELGLGLIAGTEGKILRFQADALEGATLEGAPDIAAVALDPEGRAWAASLGKLWTADPGTSGIFRLAWSDATWQAPFVSLFADVGRVFAMTADGGILEGRFEANR